MTLSSTEQTNQIQEQNNRTSPNQDFLVSQFFDGRPTGQLMHRTEMSARYRETKGTETHRDRQTQTQSDRHTHRDGHTRLYCTIFNHLRILIHFSAFLFAFPCLHCTVPYCIASQRKCRLTVSFLQQRTLWVLRMTLVAQFLFMNILALSTTVAIKTLPKSTTGPLEATPSSRPLPTCQWT